MRVQLIDVTLAVVNAALCIGPDYSAVLLQLRNRLDGHGVQGGVWNLDMIDTAPNALGIINRLFLGADRIFCLIGRESISHDVARR